jgi:hypothetical protein
MACVTLDYVCRFEGAGPAVKYGRPHAPSPARQPSQTIDQPQPNINNQDPAILDKPCSTPIWQSSSIATETSYS